MVRVPPPRTQVLHVNSLSGGTDKINWVWNLSNLCYLAGHVN
jgi:hypothetical protein